MGNCSLKTEWMLVLVNEKPKCKSLSEIFIQIRNTRQIHQPL